MERNVSRRELEVLFRSMGGMDNSVIAQQLGITPQLVRKRMSDVYKKFAISSPGGRGNWVKLQQLLLQLHDEAEGSTIDAVKRQNRKVHQQFNSREAPDVSVFYGRKKELNTLKKWIVRDRARLVVLMGLPGMGKTSLSVKLAEETQNQFEYVVWRSLRHVPAISVLLEDLIGTLSSSSQETIPLGEDVNDSMELLMAQLRTHRYLLVLDNLETLLQSGTLAGSYGKEYEGYEELLERISTEPLKSCFLMTTQECPKNILELAGATLPVRTFELKGLGSDAQEILKVKGLKGEDKKLERLIEIYRGNPLALQIVASLIKEIFNGNVAEFLEKTTIVSSGIEKLLTRQFERLSESEKEILYIIAQEKYSVSFYQLLDYRWPPISESELMNSIQSLRQRFFIETITEENQLRYTLLPIILEYITLKVIEGVCGEITGTVKAPKYKILKHHSLFKSDNRTQNADSQECNHIVKSILDRLLKFWKRKDRMTKRLEKLLSGLKKPELENDIGYAVDNIEYLLKALGEKL